MAKENVVVLGASDNPSRYSFQAYKKLVAYGHHPILVNPRLKELEGVPVHASLAEIREAVDTLTVYVGPAVSGPLQGEILTLKPRRVIFNPGSENPALAAILRQAGISVEEACTLVLLATDQFEP
jgi:predicted CoA-binding protein